MGIPVYNGARYLAECLESVLAQNLHDLEVIVSDNASTDDSAAISMAVAERDRRVHLVRQQANIGAAANFNLVLQLASAPFFKWACADDCVAPGFLAKALAELRARARPVLCYGRTTLIDSEGHALGEYRQGLDLRGTDVVARFRRARDHRGLLTALDGVIRTDVLRQVKPMGSFPSSDEALMVELTLRGTFHEIAEPMLLRRMHPQAASAGGSVEARQEHLDPLSRGRLHLDTWRRSRENTGAALRSPLPVYTRLRLVAVVIRSMVKNWRPLRWELGDLLRYLAGRTKARWAPGRVR